MVAAGGGLGASLRYITSIIFKFFYPNLPLATIFVNILGSFLIGLLISFLDREVGLEAFIKYFLIIGLLGSYTTFSTFSFEVIEFYNNKKFILSITYIFLSITTCIAAAYIGYNLNKM